MFKGRLVLTCHHFAFTSVTLWASNYVLTKIILDSFSAGVLGFLRCFIGFIVLLGFLIATKPPAPNLTDIPQFFLSGLLGLALTFLLFNHGATTLGPTTSSVLIATTPIFTALLAYILFRERLSPIRWFAIFTAFGGILIMSLWEGTLVVNAGIFWTIAAALSLAGYNILQRKRPPRLGAVETTTYCFFAASILLSYLIPDTVSQIAKAPVKHIVIAAYIGAFPSAVAYISWVKALALAPKTSTVSNYMFLTPFLALIMEFAMAGAFPDAGTLLGGATIMASLTLFALKRERNAPETRKERAAGVDNFQNRN